MRLSGKNSLPYSTPASSTPATDARYQRNAYNQSVGQAQKLGLESGVRFALDEAPAGWMLDSPPAGVVLVDAPASADVIVAFVTRAADLAPRIPTLAERIHPAGALWIAWPRKAAGHVSDLGDTVVRQTVLEFGLVDTKVAAIDADWSALKFVWRLENRPR